jgi:hypothetical protein
MRPDSSAILNAVVAKLGADTELLALVPNGVYEDLSPPNATRFVIVSQIIATDTAVFQQGRVIEDALLLVEARMRSSSNGDVRAAAARLDTLLEDGTLEIPNYQLMAMFREEFIRRTEVDEVDPTIVWRRRGGRYRVQAYRPPPPPPYVREILEDGATAYYRLGETSGLLLDQVATAHGIVTGGPVTRGVPGALAGDGALQCIGAGWVRCPVITLGPVCSVEVWVKQDAADATVSDFIWTNRGQDADGGFNAHIELKLISGRPAFGEASHATSAPSGNWSDGAWHHIVGTSTGASVGIYVDGALVTAPNALVLPPMLPGPGLMGHDDLQGTPRLAIDEVALYPRALTALQIARHYALGVATRSTTAT